MDGDANSLTALTTLTTDRFGLMVRHLAGEAPAPPPALAGQVHRMPIPDGRDPYPEQHRREVEAAAAWRELAGDGDGGDGSADPD